MKNIFRLMLLIIPLMNLHSEGSKQLFMSNPSPSNINFKPCINIFNGDDGDYKVFTPEADANRRLFVRIIDHTTEMIYIGMKSLRPRDTNTSYFRVKSPSGSIVLPYTVIPTSGAVGYIANETQVANGPTKTFGTGGYVPIEINPIENGDYYIEFNDNKSEIVDNTPALTVGNSLWLSYFDVTVGKPAASPTSGLKTHDAIDGRMWAKIWPLYNKLNDVEFAYINLDYFIYHPTDSVVNKLTWTDARPGGWNFITNKSGVTNTGNLINDRKSNDDTPVNKHLAVPEYPILFSLPDPNAFKITTLKPEFTFEGLKTICSTGQRAFYFKINRPGRLEILIEPPTTDLDGTYDPGTKEKILLVQDANSNLTYVVWDGKDGQGNTIANGVNLKIKSVFAIGSMNNPMFDVDELRGGVKVAMVAPTGVGFTPANKIYFDDTNLSAALFPIRSNYVGCTDACHIFTGNDPGDQKWMNQWWNATENVININIPNTPQTPVFNILVTGQSNCPLSGGTIKIAGFVGGQSYNVNFEKNDVAQATQTITSNTLGEIILPGLTQGKYDNFVVNQGTSCTTTDNTTVITFNCPPVANNDANTVNVNFAVGTNTANGVIKNTTTGDTDVDSDVLTVVEIRTGTESGSGTSGTVGTPGNTNFTGLEGAYGRLKLYADGSYTYGARITTAYAIPPGESRTDVFTYKISDGFGGFDYAELVITIKQLVIAENDINQTPKNTTVSGQLMTNDEGVTSITSATDGSPFTFGTSKDVSGVNDAGTPVAIAGSLTINADGTYTFVPATDFTGTINPVTYTGIGANGNTDTAILSIEVLPFLVSGNNTLVAQNDVNSTEFNTTLNSTVINNDSDPDRDAITVTSAGSLDNLGAPIVFTIGSEIQVSGVSIENVPVANAGKITLNSDGTYVFIPTPDPSGFKGIVNNITYTISDGNGGTDTAILSINVITDNGNNTFANDDANSAPQGVTMNGNILTNDEDPEVGQTQTVTGVTIPAQTINGISVSPTTLTIDGPASVIPNVGSITVNANGTYTFVPIATFIGTLRVPYSITDNGTPAAIDEATLYLTSLPAINAKNDINQTPMNTPVSGQLITNDENVTSVTAAGFTLGTPKNVSGVNDAGTSIDIAGTLTINGDGTYTFVPTTGFTGTIDPVTYTGVGANGITDNAILSIEVLPVLAPGNNPPVAQNDVNSTEVNVTLNSTVINNDSDPDGDVFSVTSASITLGSAVTVQGVNTLGATVTAGTVNLSSNGTYEYIPALGFTGIVNNITYTISDGNGATDTAILSINVIGNNGNNTFANDDTNSAPQGVTMTGNILTNDEDPEVGHTQTVTGVTIPAQTINGISVSQTTLTLGTASVITNVGSITINTNGTYTFVPIATFIGTLRVPYSITDNGTPAAIDEATLYLTSLSAINAENDINQTPMNTPVSGQLITNDENVTSVTAAGFTLGTSKTVSGVNDAGTAVSTAGTLTINGDGTYTFVPTTGFTGTIDPVTYTGVGANGITDNAILSIEVLPVLAPGNNPPVAQNDVNSTEVNVTLNSTVINNDSDPDGDVLIVTNASSVNSSGTTITFTIGTQITVSGINTANVAVADAGKITLNSDGTYTYIPALGFTGIVNNITYTISDGNGGTDTAILSINVIGNNGNNTFANDDTNSAPQGVTMNGNILTNDEDPEVGHTQTVTGVTIPAQTINGISVSPTTLTLGGPASVIPNVGSIIVNADGTYTFVPIASFIGTLRVPYSITDNGTPAAIDEATLYLTSLPAINAENDINQTPMNTPVSGQLITNDENVTSVTAAGFTLGTSKTVSGVNDAGTAVSTAGTLTINGDGTYTFVPTTGFTGTIDPVTYTGVGANGITDNAILSIEVLPVLVPGNNPPVAQNDVNSTEVGVTLNSTVINNDSDPDGDVLIVTNASSVNSSGTTITFTIGTQITVSGINTANVAVADAGNITLNSDGTYTYIPALGFTGIVNNITYTISDGNGGTDTAILSINVIGNNGNNTFANDDTNSAPQGVTMNGNILTNDEDPEVGHTQTVTGVTIPAQTINGISVSPTTLTIGGLASVIPNVGSITVNANGTYTFVPIATFIGTLRVPYSITDNGTPAAIDEATLYLTTVNSTVIINLKAMLQGARVDIINAAIYTSDGLMRDNIRLKGLIPLTSPYSGVSQKTIIDPTSVLADKGSNSIVDWVIVEFRNATTPSIVLYSEVGLIQRDGDIVDVDGVSPLKFLQMKIIPGGTAYIAVRHRNHLGIMTSLPVNLGIDVYIDFTTANLFKQTGIRENPSFTYNNIKMLWGGDVNANGQIRYTGDANDNVDIYNSIMTFPGNTLLGTSYTIRNYYGNLDVNMNGEIRYSSIGNDKNLIYTNILVNSVGNILRGTGYTAFYDNLP